MAVLRHLVERHLDEAIELAEAKGTSLSLHARLQLRAITRCGDPEQGFRWLRCHDCHVDRVVGLSCKTGVICPRCGGRWMASTAAHLVDHILPDETLRQWVITFPQPLPRLLAWRPELLQRVLACVATSIEHHLRKKTRHPTGKAGLVSFIQTFTGDLRLYVHLHVLVPEGLWFDADTPRFVRAGVPTQDDLRHVAEDLSKRIRKTATRWARTLDPDATGMPTLEALGRLGELREVMKVACSKKGTPARKRRWVARCDGLEVEASVKITANDTTGRERLARYAARPGLSMKRLSLREDGCVKIHLKRAWKNGTTAVVLRPEVFLLRLAALMLPAGVNRVRYHRIFAPASPGRSLVAPGGLEDKAKKRSRWIRWADLISRVFGRHVDTCPRCHQKMDDMGTLQGDGRAWDVLRWIERSGNLTRDGPDVSRA